MSCQTQVDIQAQPGSHCGEMEYRLLLIMSGSCTCCNDHMDSALDMFRCLFKWCLMSGSLYDVVGTSMHGEEERLDTIWSINIERPFLDVSLAAMAISPRSCEWPVVVYSGLFARDTRILDLCRNVDNPARTLAEPWWAWVQGLKVRGG